MLLLWDIDGTILHGAAVAQARALHVALGEVLGLSGTREVNFDAAGRTDVEIARLICRALDVPDADFDAIRDRLVLRWGELHDELCEDDLSGTVLPGIEPLLEDVARAERARMSIVTGNLEPIARRKLRAAGVSHVFEPGQGGFGSDAEDRRELPRIARGRAGDHPREATLVIGDTPRDIACARADGTRVFAITTGPYSAADLADADEVVDDAAGLRALLDDLGLL